jgi:hypothetical protein
MQPSQAKHFFEQVRTAPDSSSFLRSLISSTEPTYETEWLEFKGGASLLDNELKKTWSEALAGFANTQGGVLIFGIDARQDRETGIDAACGESLVPNVHAFVSRLQQLHGQSTEPSVLGVEYCPAPANNESANGFVVCYIPESPYRPHRAEAAGRNYYIRASDKFLVPSVSLLRALFYPRSQALITPTARGEVHVQRLSGQDIESHEISIQLQNYGTASGYDVYVSAEYQPRETARPHVNRGSREGHLQFPYSATLLSPIHPCQRVDCMGFTYIYTECPSDHYKFTIRIFAKDTEVSLWLVELSRADLDSNIERVAVQQTA